MFERGVAVLIVARRLVGPAQDWIRDGLQLAEIDHDDMIGAPVRELEQRQARRQPVADFDREQRDAE